MRNVLNICLHGNTMQSLVSATGSWKNHESINKHHISGHRDVFWKYAGKIATRRTVFIIWQINSINGEATNYTARYAECCRLFTVCNLCHIACTGKAFVRRLVNTTLGVKKPFHFVALKEEARADIRMWFMFFMCHNGENMFLSPVRETSISLNLYSDACKKACSVIFQSCWFVIKFPVSW